MKDILVVEDQDNARERLINLFTDAGYAVHGCRTVTEAEDALKHHEFRLGFLDIGLEDKSGSYLFNSLKTTKRVSYIIIFTGNPSVHLKQRFLSEGATDYIVKGSSEAADQYLLSKVKEIIGTSQGQKVLGMELTEFLNAYVDESSRKLFYESDNTLPECSSCGSRTYIVTFSHEPQVPPEVTGKVLCSACNAPLDPDLG